MGVLAVDPTSPFTGGALLGDRVRMQEHATDGGVFIRSMASRGHLGGLSWAVPQALRILDEEGLPAVYERHRRLAAAAGLRTGDVITKINGQPAASPVQLQELTLSKKAGDTVDLEVWRSGQTASVTVTLGTQP